MQAVSYLMLCSKLSNNGTSNRFVREHHSLKIFALLTTELAYNSYGESIHGPLVLSILAFIVEILIARTINSLPHLPQLCHNNM